MKGEGEPETSTHRRRDLGHSAWKNYFSSIKPLRFYKQANDKLLGSLMRIQHHPLPLCAITGWLLLCPLFYLVHMLLAKTVYFSSWLWRVSQISLQDRLVGAWNQDEWCCSWNAGMLLWLLQCSDSTKKKGEKCNMQTRHYETEERPPPVSYLTFHSPL